MRERRLVRSAQRARDESGQAEELEGGDDLPCSCPQTNKLPQTNRTTLSVHHEEEHEVGGMSPQCSYHGVNSSDHAALKRSDKTTLLIYLTRSPCLLSLCAHNTNKKRRLSCAFFAQELVKWRVIRRYEPSNNCFFIHFAPNFNRT